jgi:hypothetical protein
MKPGWLHLQWAGYPDRLAFKSLNSDDNAGTTSPGPTLLAKAEDNPEQNMCAYKMRRKSAEIGMLVGAIETLILPVHM